ERTPSVRISRSSGRRTIALTTPRRSSSLSRGIPVPPPEDAERWIVDLIRHSPLDAKIDSKLGHVVMGTNAQSPYQPVIEKTKDL
ncbi:hypothetical protein GH825_30395, partial [Bacillus thuringiensis]|nr:hypothetical protein [Bacillus thuringiensis]